MLDPQDLVGKTIGPYRVGRLLGQGGFAWVFEATPEEGKAVALKVLKPRYAGDTQFEKRFRNEAEVAAGLQHTNIIPVLGKIDDPLLPKGEMDIVTILHAFHDFTHPVEFLMNLKKSLADDGTVVVIDWRTILQKHRVVELFEQAGYELLREETFLARDYVCIFHLPNE